MLYCLHHPIIYFTRQSLHQLEPDCRLQTISNVPTEIQGSVRSWFHWAENLVLYLLVEAAAVIIIPVCATAALIRFTSVLAELSKYLLCWFARIRFRVGKEKEKDRTVRVMV